MPFDEDAYRDKQLNKHLDGDDTTNSNCCEAPILEGSSICSECNQNCVSIADDEYDALCEKGDAEHERRRDEEDD